MSSLWEHVLDLGFGVCNVVRANPSNGDVWAGGETTVMQPWIARSVDRGDTWQVVFPDLAGDNACNSIALHPGDPLRAWAGMEGPLLETLDGGATWQPTGLTTPAYLYGVALDAAAPSHLLAGGMIQPNRWGLWESVDGGDTWVEVPPPVPGATGISAILADPFRPGTFYVATFGHGVWRYRRTVTESDPPPGGIDGLAFALAFPNPSRAAMTLEFEIPAALTRARVRLDIHSARGERVRTLLDATPGPGVHRIAWDGRDTNGRLVPPGVYFGRLEAEGVVMSRKVGVVR